jgi:hypothetical protein
MLTFKDLKTQALTLLDQAGDLSTGNQGDVLMANALAMAHEKRLVKDRWSFMLWPNPVSFTFQSQVRNYTLHPLALMLSDFVDFTAGQLMRETPTRARYKLSSGVGGIVQNDQYHFEFIQDSPIKLPFAAGKLTVQSGNATIYYVDVNGNSQSDIVTSGLTTSQSVDTVYGVTKNDGTALTLNDSAATTVLSLGATQYGIAYPQIRLYDNPNAGDIAKYRFYRKPRTLSADNDVPEIPYPFSRVLVYDALLELYTYNDAQPPDYWLAQQAEWDLLLKQNYQEGETEGSETRTVQEHNIYQG